MKKFGDNVIYVRNGVELNAQVVSSSMAPRIVHGISTGLFAPDGTKSSPDAGEGSTLEEHLQLTYLDPVFAKEGMGSTDLDRARGNAFSVPPLADGITTGWKELDAPSAAVKTTRIWDTPIAPTAEPVANVE